MDPDTCEREGADAGQNKRSIARRGHPRGRDDHPEMASVPTLARHSAEIRYVPPADRPARAKRAHSVAACSLAAAVADQFPEAGSMLQGMPSVSSGPRSPIHVQTSQSHSDGSLQSSSPQRSDYSPSETRPYDPIRDV